MEKQNAVLVITRVEDSGHPFGFAKTAGTPWCCEGATATPAILSRKKLANAAAMLERCFTRSVLREGPRKQGEIQGAFAVWIVKQS